MLVDGAKTNFEVYNIDGYNYFKLRDIAYVLNGTGSQFQVGFDAQANTISLETGEAYTQIGQEMDVGEDKSASAVPSAQSLLIDGQTQDLKAYNLGGNNFFQLRALGTALGFDVDYDQTENCVLIASVDAQPEPEPEPEPDLSVPAEIASVDDFWGAVDQGYTRFTAKDLTLTGGQCIELTRDMTLELSGTLTIYPGSTFSNFGTLNAAKLVMKAPQQATEPVTEENQDSYFARLFNFNQATLGDVQLEAATWSFEQSNGEDTWTSWAAPELRTGFWEDEENWQTGQPGENAGIHTTVTGTWSIGCGASVPVLADTALTIAASAKVQADDVYLENWGTVNLLGALNLTGESTLGNHGALTVSGSLTLADGKLLGVGETLNEWGETDLQTQDASYLFNEGQLTVSGSVSLGECARLDNSGTLTVSGKLTAAWGKTVLRGYYTLGDKDKVSFIASDWNDDWGQEGADDKGVTHYWFDDRSYAGIGNSGTLTVSGTVQASGLDNQGYWFEDEDGFHLAAGSIVVKDGGTLLVSNYLNNNNDYCEGLGQWALADITVDKGGLLSLARPEGSEDVYPWFGNFSGVTVNGELRLDRWTEVGNYSSKWLDDYSGQITSVAGTKFVVNGLLNMTEKPLLIWEGDELVDVQRACFINRNSGVLEISGALNNTGSRLINYNQVTVLTGGTLTETALPLDLDGDGTAEEVYSAFFDNYGTVTVLGTLRLTNPGAEICNYDGGVLDTTGGAFENSGDVYEITTGEGE